MEVDDSILRDVHSAVKAWANVPRGSSEDQAAIDKVVWATERLPIPPKPSAMEACMMAHKAVTGLPDENAVRAVIREYRSLGCPDID